MPTKTRLFIILAVALLVSAATTPAYSRDDELTLPIKEALQTSTAKEKLTNKVPLYFAGQGHPAIKRTVGEWATSKRTRGIMRPREESCQVAFISALIVLQTRALNEKADAVVNIASIVDKDVSKSATHYKCTAGKVMVNVTLKGTVVKY